MQAAAAPLSCQAQVPLPLSIICSCLALSLGLLEPRQAQACMRYVANQRTDKDRITFQGSPPPHSVCREDRSIQVHGTEYIAQHSGHRTWK